MTLFDKNKQQSSNPDLSSIKQASNPNSLNNNNNGNNPSQLPSFNSNINSNPNNNGSQGQDEFVNPFNSNSNNSMNNNNNPNGFYDSNNMSNTNSYQPPSYDQQMPAFNSSSNPGNNNSMDSMNMGQGGFSQPSVSSLNSGDFISKEQAEEIIVQTVESVLEDKWEDITKNVRKVVEWKDKVESQITLVKEDIVSLQDAFSTLEKRLISKLNNYDKSILDVGSEIKALDKVFQKVTPTLVNNVTELGRIAKELKSVSNANKNFEE